MIIIIYYFTNIIRFKSISDIILYHIDTFNNFNKAKILSYIRSKCCKRIACTCYFNTIAITFVYK